jgi:hypothetical protein
LSVKISGTKKLLILPFKEGQKSEIEISANDSFEWYIFQKDTIGFEVWYMDSAQQLVWQYFTTNFITEIKQVIPMPNWVTAFQTTPTSGGYAILASGSKGFVLYNQAGNKLFEQMVKDSLTIQPFFTYNKYQTLMIGYTNASQHQMYWYDLQGALYHKFPLSGKTSFITGDVLLNKSDYLIGGDSLNHLILYRLK